MKSYCLAYAGNHTGRQYLHSIDRIAGDKISPVEANLADVFKLWILYDALQLEHTYQHIPAAFQIQPTASPGNRRAAAAAATRIRDGPNDERADLLLLLFLHLYFLSPDDARSSSRSSSLLRSEMSPWLLRDRCTRSHTQEHRRISVRCQVRCASSLHYHRVIQSDGLRRAAVTR